MYKLIKLRKWNKKGSIGEAMQEIVGIFVIAFVLLFFFLASMLFGLPKKSMERIRDDISTEISKHYFELSTIQKNANIDYNGIQKTSLSNLARLAENNAEAKKILELQGLALAEEGLSISKLNDGDIHIAKK